MNLTLIEKTKLLYDDHIFINISDSDIERHKAESARANYSNQTAKNYASINSLVSNAFVKYLRENLYTNNEQITINIPEIWEFVNGGSLTINIEFNDDDLSENEDSKNLVKKVRKLILIPSDNLNLEEFTIPQEWVDIPNWAGDYYLPVQVNLEKKYLHFWGYISRQSLKQKAEYNDSFRNYYVHQSDIISDLDLLWSVMIICEEKGVVESLPELLPNSSLNLINQLSEVDRYSPRLKVSFAQWGALLNDEKYLTDLYEQRIGLIKTEKSIDNNILVLSNWLNNINSMIDQEWEKIDQFINRQTPQLAFRFRGERKPNSLLQNNVARFIKAQKQFSFPAEMSEEEKLVKVFKNTEQEHIRWEAVEYLWKINPLNPELPILKILDLGVQLQGNPIGLMVGVFPKEQEKVAIFLRVYPLGSVSYLPCNLKLMILDENDELFMEAISRDRDNWIQLYFTADKGDSLSFGVSLNSASMIEHFIV